MFVIGGFRGIKTASIVHVVVEKEGNLEGGINGYLDEKNGVSLGEERNTYRIRSYFIL
jgi:uridine phosphorylase